MLGGYSKTEPLRHYNFSTFTVGQMLACSLPFNQLDHSQQTILCQKIT